MYANPIMILLYVGISAYIMHMYWDDYRAAQSHQSRLARMPGATKASYRAFLIAIGGSFFLLTLETGGEIVLGVADEQSDMVWYFVFALVAAGIVEEVIFRGYLVVENKGKVLLIATCVCFSFLFAIMHAHLWSIDGSFKWTFTTKTFFTTGILFANSLWFYAARFGPWNPKCSLFPCMLAHATSNLGVFFIKLFQGYVIF